MRTRPLLTSALAIALCAGMLAACGGDDDDSGADAAATDWLEAISAQDYEGACEFMAPESFPEPDQCVTAMKLLDQQKLAGEVGVQPESEEDGKAEITITGAKNGDFTLFLSETDGEWLITSIDASSLPQPGEEGG